MKFEKIKKQLEKIKALEIKRLTDGEIEIKNLYGVILFNNKQYYTSAKLTPSQSGKDNAIDILRRKELKRIDSKWRDISAKFERIENTTPASVFDICLYWSYGSAYGAQAVAKVETDIDSAGGNKTSGCGYDKRSTAAASALNYSDSILCAVLQTVEKLPQSKIYKMLSDNDGVRDALGYGLYFSPLPRFDGGVGMSSIDSILKNCGYVRNTYSESKYCDVYGYSRRGGKK